MITTNYFIRPVSKTNNLKNNSQRNFNEERKKDNDSFKKTEDKKGSFHLKV